MKAKYRRCCGIDVRNKSRRSTSWLPWVGRRVSFGNEGVGVLRAAGLVDFDFSVLKDFHLMERVRLEFRGEFFNAFNHTNFGLPGLVFGSSTFGVIN